MKNSLSLQSAALFEFITKILIDRIFFQSNGIDPKILIYLIDDIIKSLHTKINEPEKLNFFKEISILYKQIFGKTLTDEEERYDREIHELDVVGEIVNVVRYAIGFSFLKGIVSSVSSAVTQKFTEHIPYIVGYSVASYFGPSIIPVLVDRSLSKISLSEDKKEILRPWLKAIMRSAMGFIPKVEANGNGVMYQYPRLSGHLEWHRNISAETVINNGFSDKNTNSTLSEEDVLTFKIVGVKSLEENQVEITVINPKNEKHDVKFSMSEKKTERSFKIECMNKEIEGECVKHLANMFNSTSFQSESTSPAELSPPEPLILPPSLNANSFVDKAIQLSSSMVVPSILLASSEITLLSLRRSQNFLPRSIFNLIPKIGAFVLSSPAKVILGGVLAQTTLTSAINSLQMKGPKRNAGTPYDWVAATQKANFLQMASETAINMVNTYMAAKRNPPLMRRQRDAGDINPMSFEYQVNNVTDGNQQNSAMAKLADGNLVYIYETYGYFDYGNDFLVKILTPYGEEVVPEFTISNTGNTPYLRYPNLLALPDGNFFGIWSERIGDTVYWNIWGNVFSYNGTTVTPGVPFPVAQSSTLVQEDTSLALINSNQVLVTWCNDNLSNWSLAYQIYFLNGTAVQSPTIIGPTEGTIGYSATSSDGNPDGSYAIATVGVSDQGDLFTQAVYVLPFSNQGVQLPMIRIDNNSEPNNFRSIVRSFPNSNWIVIFNNAGPTSGIAVHYTIFNSSWQPLASELILSYEINYPFVATSANNNFLIIGQMYSNPLTVYDVVAQFFNGLGQPIGNLFVIHNDMHDVQATYLPGEYMNLWIDGTSSPVLVNVGGDNFSLTYTSNGQDDSLYGVFARYLDSSFGVYTANWTVTFPEGSIFNGLNDFSNPAFYNPNVIYYLTLSNPAMGNLTVTTPPITCSVTYNSDFSQMTITGQSYNVNKEVFPYLQLLSEPFVNGIFSLNVTAVDLSNFRPTFYRLMTLNVTYVDHPPVASQIPSQIVFVGADYNFTFPAFEDADGNEISYSAILANGPQLPSWLGFNGEARQFYSISSPTQQDVTRDALTINVIGNDGHGGSTNATFFMSIIPSLNAENLNPTYTYTENMPMNFTLPLDIETPRSMVRVSLRLFDCTAGTLSVGTVGNTTSFFNTSICEWIAEGLVNEVNSLYSLTYFTPKPYYFLNFPIIQLISDYYNEDLTGMILMQGVQQLLPPYVAHPILNVTGVEGINIAFQITGIFLDPNNDPLTYTAKSINQTWPSWLSFNNLTLTFSGRATNAGFYRIEVTATDPYNLSAQTDFTIDISAIPSKLSGGAIAGIVIACLVVVGVGLGVGYLFLRRKMRQNAFIIGLTEGRPEEKLMMDTEAPNVKRKIQQIKDEIPNHLSRGLAVETDSQWREMGGSFRGALASVKDDYRTNPTEFCKLFNIDRKNDFTQIMQKTNELYFFKQPEDVKNKVRTYGSASPSMWKNEKPKKEKNIQRRIEGDVEEVDRDEPEQEALVGSIQEGRQALELVGAETHSRLRCTLF